MSRIQISIGLSDQHPGRVEISMGVDSGKGDVASIVAYYGPEQVQELVTALARAAELAANRAN